MEFLDGVFLSPGEGGGAAAGGDAGAASAAPAAAGEEQVRSERDYAERYGYRRPKANAQTVQQVQPDDAAAEQKQEAQRISFRDLIRSDEYKAEADEYIQGVIRDRLKGSKANEARLAAVNPVLARVAEKYGLKTEDPAAIDLEALSRKMDEDTSGLEDEALEKGMSVDTLAQLKALERQNAQLRQQQEMTRRESEERQAFAEIARQAAELQKMVPGFDVAAEMRNNPTFAKMVMPPSMRGAGLTVEEAYFATHHQEMMQAGMAAAQQRAQQQVVNAIRSGSRPIENGMTSSAGGAAPGLNPATMTQAEIKAILKRAEAGEKIAF